MLFSIMLISYFFVRCAIIYALHKKASQNYFWSHFFSKFLCGSAAGAIVCWGVLAPGHFGSWPEPAPLCLLSLTVDWQPLHGALTKRGAWSLPCSRLNEWRRTPIGNDLQSRSVGPVFVADTGNRAHWVFATFFGGTS